MGARALESCCSSGDLAAVGLRLERFTAASSFFTTAPTRASPPRSRSASSSSSSELFLLLRALERRRVPGAAPRSRRRGSLISATRRARARGRETAEASLGTEGRREVGDAASSRRARALGGRAGGLLAPGWPRDDLAHRAPVGGGALDEAGAAFAACEDAPPDAAGLLDMRVLITSASSLSSGVESTFALSLGTATRRGGRRRRARARAPAPRPPRSGGAGGVRSRLWGASSSPIERFSASAGASP